MSENQPVKIIVGNINSKIVGFMPEKVNGDLDNILSYKLDNIQHMPQFKSKIWNVKEKKWIFRKPVWDGVIHLYKKIEGQSFYTGLLGLVRDVLKGNNIPFEMIDRRTRPEVNLPNLTFTPPKKYKDRDYQLITIERAKKFTRGIIGVATGGGKTMIVTRLISEIKTYPFIFYVLTKDLMYQAHETLSECLNEPIGIIGDGKAEIKKINVCTIQTAIRALNQNNENFKIDDYRFDDEDEWDEKSIDSMEDNEKIRDMIKSAKGIYFDECHHVSSRTCKEVLNASINAYWRYGGSATPHRDTGDTIMIQALFGGKIVEITASYLIKNNHLVRPNIYFVCVDDDVKFHSYKQIYKACISHNDVLNDHIADTANYLVSKNKSTLILVQQYAQGEYLKKLIPNSIFVSGKMTSAQRKKSLQDLRDRNVMCMIATSLADEGLDVPTLDAALLAGGGKSTTRIHQRIGRTLRQDSLKPKSYAIVIMYDHHKTRFLRSHSIKIRSLLKKEKEFKIISPVSMNGIMGELDMLIDGKDPVKKLFE